MSSVRSIAKLAGVSITTVSRALNNDPAVNPKTRERVLAIANRSGYVATVGRRATTNLGFSYTGEATLSHPFDAAVLDGVIHGADEQRFDVLLTNLKRDKRPDESYTQFFLRKGIRGVILRTMQESRSICQAIADEGFPMIVISERFSSPNVSYIDGDSRADSVRAVEYLIALGHRRIAFGFHSIPDRDHTDRFAGYKDALEKSNIPFDESLVYRQRYTLAGGATVLKMVMTMRDRPTAIFFADPLLAVGAVKQAHALQISIPKDISIIGFDDTNLRYGVHPTLTAVCQDAAGLGFEAAQRLTRMLTNREQKTFQISVPTFFEVHESTGAPPAHLVESGDKNQSAPAQLKSAI
ncbi:MAG: LacI family transcriptional regulator [Planctomycetes bacterium]|nr:LacI family transcriptional regulator [Planctomycetota bacterium]